MKHKLKGTFTSPSGTSGESNPLIGWVNFLAPVKGQDNVTVVAFTTRWGKYGSVSSWSGECRSVNGKPVIKTIWHLVRSNANYEWDHMLTNSATFVPK
ncbi:avidin/streptavidin family protein [Shewanella surugensis]|uniref:avidin/streptavidin family protein n=1 Tax=Shewanella surugensis TaxID=212020 RepID=UPI0035E0B288